MNMYKQRIISNYKNPKNHGKPRELEQYSSSEAVNPNCGDEIEAFVKAEDEKIQDVRFKAEGCAISIASASLLSEELKGMEKEEIEDMDRDDVTDILGIDINPMRLKCALLARDAFLDSFEQQ